MRRDLRLSVCLLAATLLLGFGCAPAPVEGGPEPLSVSDPPDVPAGWRRVPYVSGMSLAVPPHARVLYLQGIDSRPLVIAGADFTLDLDDYGAFSATGTQRVGGRRAEIETSGDPACRETIYRVELPERVPYIMECEAGGENCTNPAGVARIVARCRGADACAQVRQIAASIHFAPPPHAPLPPPDPSARPPEGPLCQPG